ncbi:hypothetical protein JTB14_001781 [Gonioctena quinquepunctata]|nr:hypothetical protein JTB14_001781 [Gonioctena quinquepunctata]
MTKRKREDDEEPTKNSAQISKVGHWALGLLKTMEDPKFIIESDDLVTVIKDAYPKAEFHYLVLPKEDISNLKALTEDHVDLLKHMEKKANEN